jgi:hypothetical protein
MTMANEIVTAAADEAAKAKANALAIVNKAETGVVAAVVRNAKWVAVGVAVLILTGIAYLIF